MHKTFDFDNKQQKMAIINLKNFILYTKLSFKLSRSFLFFSFLL